MSKMPFTEAQMLDSANFNRKDASVRTRDRVCALLDAAAVDADRRAAREAALADGYRAASSLIATQPDGALIETLLAVPVSGLPTKEGETP